MQQNRKRTIAGVAAAGAVALALSGLVLFPSISRAADVATIPAASADWDIARGAGPRGDRAGSDEALATALGITVDELTAAREDAATAAIDQAVAEGLLTEAQATTLKERGAGMRGFGPYDIFVGGTIDANALLADALGITADELTAAREQVQQDALAAAVEAGSLTQEEADLMTARQAVQEYLTPLVESAYSEALAAAVADGAITQEQADALTAQGWGTRGFGGGHGIFGEGGPGMGGRGGRHGGMMERGGRGFMQPDSLVTPDETGPATPEEGSGSNG